MKPSSEPISAPARLDTAIGTFEPKNVDWRIWLGIIVTGVWLLVLSLYISNAVGWFNIGKVPIDTLGSFLEGSFAPLAFLWFVLAYYSQQKELAQNTEALKMQSLEMQRSVEQASIQATAISGSEMHARREAFLGTNDIVRNQLGNILAFLYLSSQGAGTGGDVPAERISDLWNQNGRKDSEAFARQLLELSFSQSARYGYKLFWGTEVRTRHSENFRFSFERLLDAADACDSNGMIRDAVAGSTHGFVYNRMTLFRDNPPAGITFGSYDFDPDSMESDETHT